jgi:hypothetical protein
LSKDIPRVAELPQLYQLDVSIRQQLAAAEPVVEARGKAKIGRERYVDRS